MNFSYNTSNKFIFDSSIVGATRAGVSVFSKNLLKELVKLKSIEVDNYVNPFSTINKKGISRKIFSLLRLLYCEFIYFRGNHNDIFFFPSSEVPVSILLSNKIFHVVIHDIESYKDKTKTTIFGYLKNISLTRIITKSSKIYTDSNYSKKDICKHFSVKDSKITILKVGLKNEFYSEHKTLFQNKNKYLLHVGSIEPRKNIPFLIDVFEEFLKLPEGRDYYLYMTGAEAWKSKYIYNRIEASNCNKRIKILGYIKDEALPELYKNATVLVYPSFAEGFGIPVIESLSQGTPVIANNNSALVEFSDFGIQLISNFDKIDWATQISTIVKNEVIVNDMYIQKVRAEFRWDNIANHLCDSLKNVN